jgi:hypothetical protein
METKSATGAIYIADTSANRQLGTITGYCCGGVLAPFSINGTNTLVVNDVNGYPGFEIGDVATGRVVAAVPFAGPKSSSGHGIAWAPDEREVWVNDGANPLVHVYAMTTMPPRQTHLVRVSNPSPHWITFSVDGRLAYVAGRKGSDDATDVIDTTTYERVGHLSPSEDLLEVDLRGQVVTRVGNQFGVGRVGAPG